MAMLRPLHSRIVLKLQEVSSQECCSKDMHSDICLQQLSQEGL